MIHRFAFVVCFIAFTFIALHTLHGHLMPTLSFKDRGAVVLVALAKAIGVDRIVQDSSGNAGHAMATYAARAGIPCEIFVAPAARLM